MSRIILVYQVVVGQLSDGFSIDELNTRVTRRTRPG
jgi:hypothetical protein